MSHSHLTLDERIRIEVFVSMGLSCREMARRLGRSHSTLSQEAPQQNLWVPVRADEAVGRLKIFPDGT